MSDAPRPIPWSTLQQNHEKLSLVDRKFRDFARQNPALLSRGTFAALDVENPLFRYKLQSWPTFIGASKVRELETASVGVSRLIRNIPERVFGNDPRKVARFYGLDESLAQTILSPPTGFNEGISRGDFVHSASGFRCVEFNMDSSLGGWETHLLADMLLRIPQLRTFIDRHRIGFRIRNTVRALLKHFIETARSAGLMDGDTINLALALHSDERHPGEEMTQHFLDREHGNALREYGSSLSGKFAIARYSELVERDCKLYYKGLRIHAILEGHLADTAPIALNSFKAGGIHLYNGLMSVILDDKRNLALVSEYGESEAASDEERELIRNHVAWTRLVRRGETRYDGHDVSLEDLVLSERGDFVLKKAYSLGGKHVILGRSASLDEWEKVWREALESGDWVVQKHVPSSLYLFQNLDGGCSPHDVVWGPFVFGSTFAGAFLRVQPGELGGVVNLTQGASQGILIEVNDESELGASSSESGGT